MKLTKNLMSSFFYLFLILFIASCNFTDDYQEERKQILGNTPFDQTILSNIHLYDSIRFIILNNLDRIFQDNKNEYRISYGANKKLQFNGDDQADFSLMFRDLEYLFNQIGKENINGLTINKDRTIRIGIRSKHIAEYWSDIREGLTNDKKDKSISLANSFAKDTLLANWHYYIWVDKRAEF